MRIRDIDVNFDFTSDTKGFWEGFWERNDGLGAGGADPDSRSKTLRLYSQLLWSKPLPNGELMELEDGRSKFYLKWKDFYFGNDSITASFRYYRNRPLLEEVKKNVPDYHQFVETYLHQLYQIGGEVILPSAVGGINQTRGFRADIRDRWDLTLECIRRFYNGDDSPLSDVLNKNKAFFELFVDFKGYVDFFFFQDLVDKNYASVKLWLDTPLFVKNPIPKTVDEYFNFLNKEIEFVESRNIRIQHYINSVTKKDEFTTMMHADLLAEDGWSRLDVMVLGAYANILKGIKKADACKNHGITIEEYDENIERVKKL
ncbi:hypothetical protein PRMUPPPA20_14290 [Xylanibacter ruminicola]|uniref:Uncharacterized protein n=2 Tax=Xylanibacter ruminicola TaxID=839 RepID=D5ERK6_XYLR2|nr:hypothetical protein [Xylanibacter ruminicola]ADE81138.1 hypothetical protein PRU_0917 [Xylanibacter ruminicola 23]GJG33320.1 hypothetical protein PRMUPPPA20_14290 [Xylanibacter ruminicola]SEI02214.1 hypothetical protein SAMN02745192_2986 [Xylanibacter ruminicola]